MNNSKENVGVTNERAAKLIVDQLVQQGVRFFSLSPGSRSTAFAIAIAEHPEACSVVHFDERGSGFQALGYAKGANAPAAVLVTSGTAVGNLLPAVMEASVAQIPLILITTDRPQELRGIGSNQTVDQVKIFRDYVRWQLDLPCSDPLIPDAYLGTSVAHAVFQSMHAPKGPVQLNCMFREPLFSQTPLATPHLLSTHYEKSFPLPASTTLEGWASLLASREKGVIIVGGNAGIDDEAPIYELAKKLGFPIIADILSGIRTSHSHVIPYSDLILKTVQDLKVDTVLHFGDRLVSKTLLEWLAASSPSLYFLVAAHPVFHDPKHQVTHRLECSPSLFSQLLYPHLEIAQHRFFQEWKNRAESIEICLEQLFADQATLTEPGLANYLAKNLPTAWSLFLANSMPVRDADTFFFPKHEKSHQIFANRGVSGIDGNIATVVGIAHAIKRPIVAVLGDQTFLHDLNSLALLKKCPYPVLLLVVNNAGGAIFSFLPIASKKELMDDYFAATHDLTFQ
ncbi:MAG: 2-succinyl-5-enolpyruvyl-6-hydroxy-3-cyclohexene-1-carboxylic-acid synthase, partial [Chlamydiales bacterium]